MAYFHHLMIFLYSETYQKTMKDKSENEGAGRWPTLLEINPKRVSLSIAPSPTQDQEEAENEGNQAKRFRFASR